MLIIITLMRRTILITLMMIKIILTMIIIMIIIISPNILWLQNNSQLVQWASQFQVTERVVSPCLYNLLDQRLDILAIPTFP